MIQQTRPRNPRRYETLRRMRENHLALAGALGAFLLALAATVGPIILRHFSGVTPQGLDLANRMASISTEHLLGTDVLGRDLLARLFDGTRISLIVGLAGALISGFVGITYGAISGYMGGRADQALMRAIDVLYSLPDVLAIAVLVTLFERSFLLLLLALGSTSWLTIARITRGQVLTIKTRAFVDAARTMGASPTRIVIRHLIPNCAGPVVVYATLAVPSIILSETFLSFLGLGVPPPSSSLGVLANEGAQAISVDPLLLAAPALVLTFMLLCLNFVGDGLRDALDSSQQVRT